MSDNHETEIRRHYKYCYTRTKHTVYTATGLQLWQALPNSKRECNKDDSYRLRVTGPKGHGSESVGKLNSLGTGAPTLTCAARNSSPRTIQIRT